MLVRLFFVQIYITLEFYFWLSSNPVLFWFQTSSAATMQLRPMMGINHQQIEFSLQKLRPRVGLRITVRDQIVKNVHPLSGAGIRTHDLLIMSLLL